MGFMMKTMKILRKSICILFFLFVVFISGALSQTIQISPEDSLYFGRIPEGKVAVRNLSICNLDFNPLEITGLHIEGPGAACFSIVEDPGPVTLQMLQTIVLEIQFQPVSPGSFSAYIVIESNADTSPDNVSLSGMGTDLNAGIAFERIFGGPDSDRANSVRVTEDGGFILAGSTFLPDAEFSDATLIKTDCYGQVEWSQVYGIEDWDEEFSEVIQTDDGYIAVGSKAYSKHYDPPDIWVVKTNASGTVMWERNFGGKEADAASDIIATNDGGYLIAGSYQHDTIERTDVDAYLIKLDTNGNVEWEKKYGGTAGDKASTVRQVADGGYVFVGYTESYGAGEFDVYLVKLDANGNVIWYKTYGGPDWDMAGSIALTNDNGYLIAGWTANFGARARDIYLVKTDADGNEQWHRLYGDEHKDEAHDVIATSDGGYLVVGALENTYFSSEWRTDLYIIKTDASGDELWSKTYGDYNNECAFCAREVIDGGYIISGKTNSYGNKSEIYLLKIDRQGGFSSVFDYEDVQPDGFHLAQNFPNPFNNQTSIVYHLPRNSHVCLKIYNVNGQLKRTLVNEYQQSGSYILRIDLSDLPSGLYFYQINASDFKETKKMLLIK